MAKKALNELIDGRYRLLSELGRGTMGVVYRAEQRGPDGRPLREVALKMARDELTEDRELIRRLLREIWVLTNLRSPQIVTLISI